MERKAKPRNLYIGRLMYDDWASTGGKKESATRLKINNNNCRINKRRGEVGGIRGYVHGGKGGTKERKSQNPGGNRFMKFRRTWASNIGLS